MPGECAISAPASGLDRAVWVQQSVPLQRLFRSSRSAPTLNRALRNGSFVIVTALVQLPAGAASGATDVEEACRVTVNLSLGVGDWPGSLISR